jgi:hypothetical protein
MLLEKLAVSKREFKSMKKNPFGKNQVPFSRLSRWQKARVGAGIGANLMFGVVPMVGAAAYGAKRLLHGKDTVSE